VKFPSHGKDLTLEEPLSPVTGSPSPGPTSPHGSSPIDVTGTEALALSALSEHPFFAGLRPPGLTVLARNAYRQTFLDRSRREVDLGRDEAPSAVVLVAEGRVHQDSDVLWVVEKGSVQVSYQGELLGMLEGGSVFGEARALSLLDEEPFTVELGDGPLVAWRVLQPAFQQVMTPEAKQIFERHMDRQVTRLLAKKAQQIRFFAHCQSQCFDQFVKQMKAVYFRAGEEMTAGGDKADHLLVVPVGAMISEAASMSPELKSATAAVAAAAGGSSDEESPRRAVLRTASSAVEALLGNPSCLIAGKEVQVFGDEALLSNNRFWPMTIHAVRDCLGLSLPKAAFLEVLATNPNEKARYQEMADVRFSERDHCGRYRLHELTLFRRCSELFRSSLASLARPQVIFSGAEIISEGCLPPGLTLLMTGTAEEILDGEVVGEIKGPESFGAMQWLGNSPPEKRVGLRAKTMCQVLTVRREQLLECLQKHPGQSTKLVAEQLRRASQSIRASKVAAEVQHRSMWHLPLCRGCSSEFLSTLISELELCKLIPGQSLFQGELNFGVGGIPSKHALDNEQLADHMEHTDFIVVLLTGEVELHSSKLDLQLDHPKASAPAITCGLSAPLRKCVVASAVCEVHRLSMASMSRAAAQFPRETKKFVNRIIRMQKAEEAQGRWAPANTRAALRKVENFKDSEDSFLDAMLAQLTAEVFLPGEVVVREGDPIDSTIFLECGAVSIEKVDTRNSKNLLGTEQIGQVSDGYWVGDLSMFAGVSKRRATVKASTTCKTHRLMNTDFVELLSRFPAEGTRFRELAERRFATLDTVVLEQYPFFKRFSRTLLNNLRSKCRPRVFFANEIMMRQGEQADSLFLLGRESSVVLEANGVKVKEINGAVALGTKSLLSGAPVKRASTVITKGMCTVNVLSRDDWLEALTHDPTHRLWLADFAKEHLQEVRSARKDLMQKLTHHRNMQQNREALKRHCLRMASGEEAFFRPSTSPKSGIDPLQSPRSMTEASGMRSPRTPRTPRTPRGKSMLTPRKSMLLGGGEVWECFNGAKAVMPSLQLPRLGGGPQVQIESPRKPSFGDSDDEASPSSHFDDNEEFAAFMGRDPGDTFTGVRVEQQYEGSFMLPPRRARSLRFQTRQRSSASVRTSGGEDDVWYGGAGSDSDADSGS